MSNQIQASIGILAGGKNSRLNGLKKWKLKINDLSLIERSIKISKCFKKQYNVGKKELEIKDVEFLKDNIHYKCGFYSKKLLFQIEKNIKIKKLSLKSLLSHEDIILVNQTKKIFLI